MDFYAALRRFEVRPKKSLGQNFLFDEAVLNRIVAAGHVGPGDTVLEIGAGAGSLTRALAHAAGRVVAVEVDARLLPVLEYTTGDLGNVEVVHGDIMQLNPQSLIDRPPHPAAGPQPPGPQQYKVVANIPYYITSAVIRRLLEASLKPTLLVLTVQREVAERICAAPPQLSLLAVGVQFYGRPRLAGVVPAGAFYPAPDVDSAIVRIELAESALLPPAEIDSFFAVVKAGFSQKRKQIRNALASGLQWKPAAAEAALAAAGIAPARRAETLTLDEWLNLHRAVSAGSAGPGRTHP